MTDEQLHEYWKVTEDKTLKRKKKIKRVLIILAIIISIIIAVCWYLMSWVHIPAEELQIYADISGDTVTLRAKNLVIDDKDFFGGILFKGDIPYSEATVDYESNVIFYSEHIKIYARRIALLLYDKGDSKLQGCIYTTTGKRKNGDGYVQQRDENGVMHTLTDRRKNVYYDNPGGESVLIFTFKEN